MTGRHIFNTAEHRTTILGTIAATQFKIVNTRLSRDNITIRIVSLLTRACFYRVVVLALSQQLVSTAFFVINNNDINNNHNKTYEFSEYDRTVHLWLVNLTGSRVALSLFVLFRRCRVNRQTVASNGHGEVSNKSFRSASKTTGAKCNVLWYRVPFLPV